VIIPNQLQQRVAAEARAVVEARMVVEAEAEEAVGAHPLEVEAWSIRRPVAEAVAEEVVVAAAEEKVVDDPDHLRFIKVRGFLLDTFLPI
jgi:hypothetical protein